MIEVESHGPRALALVAVLVGVAGCASPPSTLAPVAERPAYDPAQGRWISESEVWDRILAARYVLLGEHHDHPDHHLHQAAIVGGFAERGRRPALGFEMLDGDDRQAIRELIAQGTADPEAWRHAVGWDESGWPAWNLYEPIFAAALETGLPIFAAQLPAALKRRIVAEGAAALPTDELRSLAIRPLPGPVRADLEESIREGHCQRLPEAQIPRVVEIQRIWEAWMAETLRSMATADGAVLIVGRGHGRSDRGIPWALEQLDPPATTLSIAFVEADLANGRERDWQRWEDEERADLVGYDLVFVTRPFDRGDPCERLPLPAQRVGYFEAAGGVRVRVRPTAAARKHAGATLRETRGQIGEIVEPHEPVRVDLARRRRPCPRRGNRREARGSRRSCPRHPQRHRPRYRYRHRYPRWSGGKAASPRS